MLFVIDLKMHENVFGGWTVEVRTLVGEIVHTAVGLSVLLLSVDG